MTMRFFQFNEQKAIEAIIYLAQKIKSPSVYRICKLLYLADKANLEKYGRFIFGETYCAMKEGATPSNAYDLLKGASPRTHDAFKRSGNRVLVLRSPNLDYLSRSDIESLDEISDLYENLPNSHTYNDAHDKAWRLTWENRGTKNSAPIPVERIAALLNDADELIDYLANAG